MLLIFQCNIWSVLLHSKLWVNLILELIIIFSLEIRIVPKHLNADRLIRRRHRMGIFITDISEILSEILLILNRKGIME